MSGQLHALTFHQLNARVDVHYFQAGCCGEQISLMSLPAMKTILWAYKVLHFTILFLRQFSYMSFKHRYDFQGLWIFHYTGKKKYLSNVPGFNVRGNVISSAALSSFESVLKP
jgi:hypothetical protein